MKLIKFCKPQHNIHRGAKLQLGTLYGYRSIEDPALRDEFEATSEFTIEFPEEIELETRWLNLLNYGSMNFGESNDTPHFQGAFYSNIEKMHIVRQDDHSVVLKDTLVSIKRDMNNSFIFCMSLMDEVIESPFPEYKDHWALSADKVNEFAQRLANLVFSQAKINDFDNSLAEMHSPASASHLRLNIRHKKVVYRDRNLIITPNNKPSFEELIQFFSDIEFIKPKNFQDENEYRFVFELNDGKNIYMPKNKNLLLTLNPFSDL
jgi:hypothetical protein